MIRLDWWEKEKGLEVELYQERVMWKDDRLILFFFFFVENY